MIKMVAHKRLELDSADLLKIISPNLSAFRHNDDS
jgi:hypothetical protein